MKLKKFILCTVTALLLLPSNAFAAGAATTQNASAKVSWPSLPALDNSCAYLMDGQTDAVLYQKNATKKLSSSSLNLIMTAGLALEKLKLTDTVTFSQNAISSASSSINALASSAGEQFTVKDCLDAIILHSYDDVAVALAEKISGSSETFVKLMNQKAKELGCKNTNFTTPYGSDDSDNTTTASDIALITDYAASFSDFISISSEKNCDIKTTDGTLKTQFGNPHPMLDSTNSSYDSRVIGGKIIENTDADTTSAITISKKDDTTLICIILDGNDKIYSDTKKLFDYGYKNFSRFSLNDNEHRTFTINGIACDLPDNSYILMPSGFTLDDLTPAVDDKTNTLAYTYKNYTLGKVSVTQNKAELKQAATDQQESITGSIDGKALTVPQTKTFLHYVWVVIRTILILFGLFLLFLVILFARKQLILYNRRKRRMQHQNQNQRRNRQSGGHTSAKSIADRPYTRKNYRKNHRKNSRKNTRKNYHKNN